VALLFREDRHQYKSRLPIFFSYFFSFLREEPTHMLSGKVTTTNLFWLPLASTVHLIEKIPAYVIQYCGAGWFLCFPGSSLEKISAPTIGFANIFSSTMVLWFYKIIMLFKVDTRKLLASSFIPKNWGIFVQFFWIYVHTRSISKAKNFSSGYS
jgi:hypothetical protein